MTKIIYFDICAVFVIVPVIVAMIVKRMNRGRTNRWFLAACGTVLFTALTDIWAVALDIGGPGNAILKYCAHTAYMLGHSFVAPICVAYILARMGFWDRNHRVKFWAFMSPAILSGLLLITLNPVRKYFFEINPNGDVYTRGSALLLLYFISFLYVIAAVVALINNMSLIEIRKAFCLLAGLLISVTATVVQYLYPYIIIECFALTIAMLIAALGVQDPEGRLYGRTGLYRLNAFKYDMGICQHNKTPVDVVVFTISNFLSVRDMLGYEYHNRCMNVICEKLFNIGKHYRLEMSFYYGGDGQFFVTIADDQDENVLMIAQAINAQFSDEITVDDIEIKFLTNVCVVRCPEDIVSVEDFIAFSGDLKKLDYTADVRYAEKLFDKKNFEIKQNIETIIERAISNDTLDLVYQPIYSVDKERFVAAEAFLRLKDPEYGNIPPEVVIREAERSGDIHAITTYLFDKVCQFVSGPEFLQLNLEWIELNMSPMQCMWTDLPLVLLSTIENYHVNPGHISLNIVDTENVQFYEKMKSNLITLRDAGIRLFMDDFGAGVFEMERITLLPLSGIKLDRQFLKMSVSEETIAILRNSVQMICDMGLDVVAVGVEDLSTRRRLVELGCMYQQGYYYSRPLDKKEFIRNVLGISDLITNRW